MREVRHFPKKHFTVMVGSEAGALTMEGILWDGKLWLVTAWHIMSDNTKQPASLVRFDHLKWQAPIGGFAGHDILIGPPMPEAVLRGTSTEGYECLPGSEVQFSVPIPPSH